MKKLYFLLLSLGILVACNKDENNGPDLDYPVTFVSKEIYNTTPVRLFTKNGEVKDTELIKTFAKKKGAWYHQEDQKIESNTGKKITLLSKSEASFISDSWGETYHQITFIGERLIMIAKEPSTFYASDRDEVFYDDLGQAISRYKKNIYDKQPLDYNRAMPASYKYHSQLSANLRGDELYEDRMVYTLKAPDQDFENSYFLTTTNCANRFDVSGLSLLRDKDTLLVQEFVELYHKQQ